MSFITVFTVSTMGFVLLVPILMVVVLLSTVSPLREALTIDTDPDVDAPEVTPLRSAA